MLRLLSIEIHKLKYNRASRNLIIVYFTLLLSIALFTVIKFDIGPIKFHLAEQGIFNFPYIWHFNTYIIAIFKFFLLLVIVSMMSNEYSYKTIKQNLIDGLSKKEFILSKFYTVVLFSGISTIFVFVISMILGLFFSDYNEFYIIFSDLEYLVGFFMKLVCFFSMGLFLGILIKRSAFAIAMMIIWFILENVLAGIIHWRAREISEYITPILPLHAMANLIKEPFTRLGAVKSIGNQIQIDLSQDYAVHFTDIIITLIWTAIFILLSYWLLKKRDL